MSKHERFANVVLGGGESGKYIAWELARQGRPVVVIERGLIGGSCPNIACLPSKNVIRSAQVANFAHHGAEYGVRSQAVAVDMAAVRARKRAMVDAEIAVHRARFAAPGVTFLLADGCVVGPRTVEARLADGGTRRLFAEHLFLDLGTRATVPDIPGLAQAAPLTHVEALELGRVPSHLIVLGVGYVGVELAQAFRRFGSRVTMVGRNAQLMPREELEVAAALYAIFQDEGIEVVLGAGGLAVEGTSGQHVTLRVKTATGEQTIEGSDLLVATGRTPNTRGIGLEDAGIALDARGFVKVDDQLQTTVPGVWAMGECAGSPMFTHAAFDDFRIVRDTLAGKPRSTQGRLVPFCVFTDPQLARVGLDQAAAQRLGIEVRIARLPMTRVLRARAIGEIRGFMKVLVESTGDQILGFTMLGAEAGEVVSVVQTAMLAGLPYTALRDAILAHPTMAEGLGALLATVPG
jgi:pyruvate/2-oxoglutarate dehydrogenase complex dihydrolipoamide dehydrogenase (E3) component